MEPRALLGPIFAIWGCLLRVSFFDTFFARQKVCPKSKNSSQLAAKGGPHPDLGVARRNARGHRGGDYGKGAEIFA